MKKEVLFFLMNEFADWEPAFLSTGLTAGDPTKVLYETKTLAISKEPVRSIGGFTVLPDYDITTLPEDYAALILVGGMQWQSREAEKILPLIDQAIQKGVVLGAICNATLFLGAHGYLNNIEHTSNTLELLKQWSGTHYTNETSYKNCQAVNDKNIVTANGTGYLEFTKEVLLLLQSNSPEDIEKNYQFLKFGLYRS